MSYNEYWNQIIHTKDELNTLISNYWDNFSYVGTWQFWVVAALLFVPLIILYFAIDKRRIFELLFFGYTVHILWTYSVLALSNLGYFVHTYFLTPVLPFGLNMAASVLPVSFLLLYQYCTNYNKNYYVYLFLLSAIFAFGFATIEVYLGLLKMEKGMNQLTLFIIDITIGLISFWFTKLILRIKATC